MSVELLKDEEKCPDGLVSSLKILNFYIIIQSDTMRIQNEAGHAPVCNGCSGKRLCQEMFNQIDTDIEDINVRMNCIKHKLIVLSGKGGCIIIIFMNI